MRDFNQDGVEDYKDDIFYMENIEGGMDDLDNIDDTNMGGVDDIPDDVTKSNINRTPRRMSGGLAFLVRMLIVGGLIFICAAFSQLLAFVVLIGWGLMEMYS